MRQQFIADAELEGTFEGKQDRMSAAEDAAPWAASIIRVQGGYMAFESVKDAQTWRNQK